MSQRESGYARKKLDSYETPEWVTEALLPHIPNRIHDIWEPACGSGKMVRVLEKHFRVLGTDIEGDCDFLTTDRRLGEGIITNPPYIAAYEFIVRALMITREHRGFVAMLLRTDYDHAVGRATLFDECPFAKKLVLRKRIRWIEGSTGSPSFNHAWFIWDWKHSGPAIIVYEPHTILAEELFVNGLAQFMSADVDNKDMGQS